MQNIAKNILLSPRQIELTRLYHGDPQMRLLIDQKNKALRFVRDWLDEHKMMERTVGKGKDKVKLPFLHLQDYLKLYLALGQGELPE